VVTMAPLQLFRAACNGIVILASTLIHVPPLLLLACFKLV